MPKVGQKKKGNAKDAIAGLANRSKPKKSSKKHLRIIARAGTGKTTTCCDMALAKIMGKPIGFTPSNAQQAIIDAIADRYSEGDRILFCAFSKEIQKDLQRRVPGGVKCKTVHSLGYQAIMMANETPEFKEKRESNDFVFGGKVMNLIRELKGFVGKHDDWMLWRGRCGPLTNAVKDLVSHAKSSFLPEDYWDAEGFEPLVRRFGMNQEGYNLSEAYSLSRDVLQRTMQGWEKDYYIDYNDMIWLPIIMKWRIPQFDLVIVDEAQDNNRLQQEMMLRTNGTITFVGDPKQAIFGFTGSDVDSMDNYVKLLGGDGNCDTLRLLETRRCGKRIVKACNKFVPDFVAHPDNLEGTVDNVLSYRKGSRDYRKKVRGGDMIITRTNAPLVRECFHFLKQGQLAYIRGGDIDKKLIKQVEGIQKDSSTKLVNFMDDLTAWYDKSKMDEENKEHPNQMYLMMLQDKYECLQEFCKIMEPHQSVEQLLETIRDTFSEVDEEGAIQLCSMHRSKGLECDRVFVLNFKESACPHPMCSLPWEFEQERNLLYVAYSRAMSELFLVGD